MDRPLASGRQPCFASRSFSPLRAVCCTGPTRSRQRPTRSFAPNFPLMLTLSPPARGSSKQIQVRSTAPGDDVDSVADFNKAIQLDPQDAKALYVCGLAKRRNGDVN